MMMTLAAFLLALAILITVHELGHYLVARWCGVKVLRFSLGFGKPLWCKRYGVDQTEWVIAMIPLGGYVKMLGENDDQADAGKHREGKEDSPIAAEDWSRAFCRQSLAKRVAIVAAGPLANLLLAVLLYATIHWVGVVVPEARLAAPRPHSFAAYAGIQADDLVRSINHHPVRMWSDVNLWLTQAALEKTPAIFNVVPAQSANTHAPLMQRVLPTSQLRIDEHAPEVANQLGLQLAQIAPRVGDVSPGSPAQQAGLQRDDVIRSINGQEGLRHDQMIALIRQSADRPVTLGIERQHTRHTVVVTPRATPAEPTVSKIGIALIPQYHLFLLRYGVIEGVTAALQRTWQMAAFQWRTLGKLITGDVSLKNLSGPLTIADYAGQTARLGWVQYVSFLALVSVSLGVLNLLPIPMLDGGHLLYYLAEFLWRRPLPRLVQDMGQRVGIALLLLMMSVALFNDVVRLVT